MSKLESISQQNNPELNKLFRTIFQNAVIKVLEEIKHPKDQIGEILLKLNSSNEDGEQLIRPNKKDTRYDLPDLERLKTAQFDVFKEVEVRFGISLDFLWELSETMTYNRAVYIQLLYKFLDCFSLDNTKPKSTMDLELESRFLMDYLTQLKNIISLEQSGSLAHKLSLEFLSQDAYLLYENWKEKYLLDPLAQISPSNVEIQESIRLCGIYGTEEEKQERAKLIKEINKTLNWVFNSNINLDFQNSEALNEHEELSIGDEKSSLDLVTGSDTIIKRVSSAIKKLIINRENEKVLTMDDFFTIVTDLNRSTNLLDSLKGYDKSKRYEFLNQSKENINKNFSAGINITIGEKTFLVLDSNLSSLIKFKLTHFSDISKELSLVLFDEASGSFLFFNCESQNQIIEAIKRKHLEDTLYLFRKNIRSDLKKVENYKLFAELLTSLPYILQITYFKLLGISTHFERSRLNLEKFINSKEYSNLYLDTFLARFPLITSYILKQLTNNPNRSKIFRVLQNIIPLSYAMRRSIFEAREIYEGFGVLESAKEANELYVELQNSNLRDGDSTMQIIADIVDLRLDLVATQEENTNNIICNGVNIGDLRIWSKLLRRPYEKVLSGINLLLKPNWHSGENGIEKAPQSNTRFALTNKSNKIALIYNTDFGEMELLGSDSMNLLKDRENQALTHDVSEFDIEKIVTKIKSELGLKPHSELKIIDPPIKCKQLGYVILSKKVKSVNLLSLKIDHTNQDLGENIRWIDPVELFIWKYWFDKAPDARPEKYLVPLAPYSTFTEKIVLDLDFAEGVKFDQKMIMLIKKLVRDSKGDVTVKEIRYTLSH